MVSGKPNSDVYKFSSLELHFPQRDLIWGEYETPSPKKDISDASRGVSLNLNGPKGPRNVLVFSGTEMLYEGRVQ